MLGNEYVKEWAPLTPILIDTNSDFSVTFVVDVQYCDVFYLIFVIGSSFGWY
jgi:hypothetical protein